MDMGLTQTQVIIQLSGDTDYYSCNYITAVVIMALMGKEWCCERAWVLVCRGVGRGRTHSGGWPFSWALKPSGKGLPVPRNCSWFAWNTRLFGYLALPPCLISSPCSVCVIVPVTLSCLRSLFWKASSPSLPISILSSNKKMNFSEMPPMNSPR